MLKKEPGFKARLVKSYRLMLDFYGMELKDEVRWLRDCWVWFAGCGEEG